MTAGDRDPVPLPVRKPDPVTVHCPHCNKRAPVNVSPGAVVEWTCRKCKRHIVLTLPEAA